MQFAGFVVKTGVIFEIFDQSIADCRAIGSGGGSAIVHIDRIAAGLHQPGHSLCIFFGRRGIAIVIKHLVPFESIVAEILTQSDHGGTVVPLI